MERIIMSAAQVARDTGLSREFVLECCRSEYGNYFAQPSKVDSHNRCTGKWLVNKEKFLKCLEKGFFVKEEIMK